MIKKVDLGGSGHHAVFGNPAPLGLLGLAVSCAALTPIAFGYALTPQGFLTAGIFSLFFGVGCQMLTGLMEFANRNTFGGTIFTAFSFNWVVTAITFFGAGFGWMIDSTVVFATEVLLFAIFIALTWGFGYYSTLLFAFLLDVDLLYLFKILKHLTHAAIFNHLIAVCTVVLGLIGLWLALAGLLNPVVGRPVFPVGRPLFTTPKKRTFDWSVRFRIHETLYLHWREFAFEEMPFEQLQSRVAQLAGAHDLAPDLHYLAEFGAVKLTFEPQSTRIASVRLTARGIDLYEQIVLRKYDTAA